ncbi:MULTISPECIES: cytochrome c oxidase assembly protein [unclassified Agrococcus]|uniref:cytochrome c oxidase assembly protein n=1 Tax=unclassified Agrococcus TaxID=2615065 RepID=UPI0036167411
MARARLIGPGAVVAAALIAVIVALELGGGAAPLSVGDPGAGVRWGTPIARTLQDIATATLIGGLVLACFALQPGSKAWDRAVDVCAAAAGVATAASAAVAFLAFRTLYTDPLSVDEQFTNGFLYFFTGIERGQYLGLATLAFAVVTTLLVVVRSAAGIAWVTAASVAPLVLLAAAGHAGTAENHTLATSSLWLHLVFVSIWVGGLIHLAVLRLDRSPSLGDAMRRYSSLALVSFAVVGFSGVASAWVRTGWDGLATPYGSLVIAKTVLLVVLGGFGAWQRTRLIPRAIETGRTRWFLVAELAFMGVAMGVANGLAQTPTPVAETLVDSSPATILTSSPLPPTFEASRLLTEWSLDPLWTVVCALLAWFYVAGVVRLHRRGDRWPALRTASWLAGLGLLWWVTSGALAVYEHYQFSFHMAGHMLLGMAVPLLLVPGAPVTLGMRAIARRTDGTRGGREWLLAIVHSRYMHVLGHPIVATGIFVVSLWIFYFSPLFRWAMENHLGHVWMVVHFVGSGYLFVQALIGIDPSPHRTPFPMRLVMLLAAMAAHAFFGVTIMTNEGLLLADWFGAMGNGVDALEDQRVGGGIAWSIGEFPTLILALVTCIMWARTDGREQRRIDRKADRDGDADLQEYNAMLERMSKR